MRKFLLLLTLLGTCLCTAQDYFQQYVRYLISVTLDDVNHQLRGHLQLHYTNNSPDTLEQMYMHLYPNAYSSKQTAFARQMVVLGDKDFALAGGWEMGGVDSLDFAVNSEPVPWALDKEHPDIAILYFRRPVLPGTTVMISTPFRVAIPRSFSRLGRIVTSYQVSQWHPKPAVYDSDGWHPMPYLDQGEFYSEFGSYDVDITLPENYVAAATGTLETSAEQRWLDSLAESKNRPLRDFPESSGTTKTLRYTANDVHDFAWFADKRFAVRRHDAQLDGRRVPCWAFFTAYDEHLWERAAEYAAEALEFYSERVGPYPYNIMAVVQAPGSPGRGMEYPMITLLGNVLGAEDLDQVIAHEVGHNWFYAILGSNERAHPWMDEGLNTLYEYWYMLDRYGLRGDQLMIRLLGREENTSDPQRLLRYYHRIHQPVSPGDAPTDQGLLEYTLAAYYKPALAFWMLSAYLGEEQFDQSMQAYFEKWRFRHPGPGDLFDSLEESCTCDLGWLEELITTGILPNYRLVTADTEKNLVTISNQGTLPAPVQVIGYLEDGTLRRLWTDGFSGDSALHFDLTNVKRVRLYDPAFSLDARPDDNVLVLTPGPRRQYKPEVRLLGGVPNTGKIPLNILPFAGWNDYDKGMLGAAFSNVQWPPVNLRWAAVPLFATNTRTLTGLSILEYQAGLVSGLFESVSVGARVRSFHYNHNAHYGFFDRYLKAQLSVQGRFRMAAFVSPVKHELRFRAITVRQNFGRGLDFDLGQWERDKRHYWLHELQYVRSNSGVLAPSQLTCSAQAGKGFLKLMADYDQKFAFREGSKGLFFHAFAGWLPHLDEPEANVLFHFNGLSSVGFSARDYAFDEILFARNTVDGFLGQQVFLKDARLKTLDRSGLSDNWMLAIGISTDTPLPIPVQPYFDITAYSDPVDGGIAVSYSGGLALVVKKNVFEVFFPIVESEDIRTSLTYIDRKSVIQRMSVVIDLTALNPFDIIDKRLD